MAKRRRRRPYQPRPVDKSGGGSTRPVSPDVSEDTQAFASAPAPSSLAPPMPSPPAIPSTGMPVSAPGMSVMPGDEDQGYARGGAIPSPMPGYSDYTMMKTDPVARRRYSPRHVKFAEGGYVDPMDYVPNQPTQQPPVQSSQFDQFNLVGREAPQVNPMLAADQPTGYAKGGPIAAAQVPAYTDPVYPAPSPANAALYADMAALRARATNPTLLQPSGSSAPAAEFQTDRGGGVPYSGYPSPITGTAVTPPFAPSRAPAQPVGPWNDAFGQLFDKYAQYQGLPRAFVEGGAVPDEGAMSSAGGPDVEGYINGDNALDPDELDGVLQQIAQLDPNQSEDVVNLTAIVQAAQSGNMDRAASILAGFRRRFDRLNAHAQGAAAHGDLAVAAQLAGKAHSQVPDGLQVSYAVGQDGNSVVATITPTGQTFQMSGQQFHDYLVGPATSFDHILENGLEKNLAIASGGQGQPGAGATGFAAGGAVGYGAS
jgi:hypothetical protein